MTQLTPLQPDIWYRRPGRLNIALQPGEAKITPMEQEVFIVKEIGGERFDALVPAPALGENLGFVPAGYGGKAGDRVILRLPASSAGRPTWVFPEKYLKDILVKEDDPAGSSPAPTAYCPDEDTFELIPPRRQPDFWYYYPGHWRITLQPGEAKLYLFDSDTIIVKEIGGEIFDAMVPTHTMGENFSSVPVRFAGRVDDRVILHFPVSNDGRPAWRVPEKYLVDILFKSDIPVQ